MRARSFPNLLGLEVTATVNPRIEQARPGSSSRRVFAAVAVALIGFAVFATFRAGILKDLHSTFADQSWGRVQFAIGAAITSMQHGGYGYTVSEVIRTVLAYGGLTGDPAVLKTMGVTFPDNLRNPSLIENAVRKAIEFQWPFNPDQQVTGSSGEDVGLVDYVRLSFILFGYKVIAFFLTYFALVAISFLAALIAFRKTPGILAILVVYAVSLLLLFESNLLDLDRVGILDPRLLSTLSLIPVAHIALVMLVRPRPSAGQVGLVMLQAAILIFAYWIRSSASWTFLGLLLLSILLTCLALWRRQPRDLARNWPFAVLAVLAAAHLTYLAHALHPVYREANERPHHALWHAIIYGMTVHPNWPRKYARFGYADVDEVPDNVAKEYLLRHPPDNPDAVYLTADRRHLRIGTAETYKRKAFLEFFANDPRFVLEAFLIHNVKLSKTVFSIYLWSLDRLSSFEWITADAALLVVATLLSLDRRGRRRFFAATLLVSAGFLVSMVPMILTAPGVAVMADQFFMLIAATASWVVVAISYVIGFSVAMVCRALPRGRHRGIGVPYV